ncbi:MAG: RagB/SusD family nutrient uptake outer membrane protein [Candidatus Pedobacter colombiensis]|uniref:RagB/SusD family nutrient uptake outer membrane protein n=1 Tax=Candidatus Pedobacter colombiensis TaxID=3121371 RepID=A0AAJ6B6H8_9SPHI|nr:RagB/SusD family nutrient uptake outer membrane protein [Pedobacter sp.]WEK19967.1 MAG: RagB/SusD family nutrient uptake outer membrane protein [Pedobacter sp.]
MRVIYVVFAIMLLASSSCKNYLDVAPEGKVATKDNFTSKDDAVAAINGLYGLMQDVVDQIWLMGEAQGDLVVPARGADKYLYDVSTHQVTPENPYADYTKFYRLVNACNGAIAGLRKLNVTVQNYGEDAMKADISEVIAIRSWAYFQLVKIWGDVPYTENFVSTFDQVTNIAPLKGNEILKKLTKDLEGAVNTGLFVTALGGTAETERFNYYSIRYMMAEMYLNTGEYQKAYEILSTFVPFNYMNGQTFRMDTYVKADWITQFATNVVTGAQVKSWVQCIKFDVNRNQTHHIMQWTNNQGNGIYAFKPSVNAIQNWSKQEGTLDVLTGAGLPAKNGVDGDIWRANGRSFLIDGRDTLIYKYLIKDNLGTRKDSYKDDMSFILARDGHTALLMAEILNRLGRSEEALLLINGSVTAYMGVRFRVRVMPKLIVDRTANIAAQVDDIILDEWALETAFEGNRWFDMVRMAKNSGNSALLANRIALKYPLAQRNAIRQRLSNPTYWYLPYYQRNVDANKLLIQKPY